MTTRTQQHVEEMRVVLKRFVHGKRRALWSFDGLHDAVDRELRHPTDSAIFREALRTLVVDEPMFRQVEGRGIVRYWPIRHARRRAH